MIYRMMGMRDYFKKHPDFNAVVHLITGAGVGIAISRPFAGVHPVRWGITLLVVGMVLHMWPWMMGKK